MTRPDYENMSNVDLCGLIASRLFGHKNPSVVYKDKHGRAVRGLARTVRAYSTSGDAMLLVIAELERRGWSVLMSSDGEGWAAVFRNGNRPAAWSTGPLPRAVAIAALKALDKAAVEHERSPSGGEGA